MHPALIMFRLLGSLFVAASISGCASTIMGNSSLYSVDRAAQYPVNIVAATFVPAIDIDIALSGKTDGALKGMGEAIANCSPSVFAGVYAPFIFVPCAVIAGFFGSVVGAWTAAPKSETDQIRMVSQSDHGKVAQEILAEKARIYLADISGKLIGRAGPEVPAPNSNLDRPEYRPLSSAAHGSILELSLLSISYKGTGRDGSPICLRMAARGRKIDATTGTVIDALDDSRTIECREAAQWLTESGIGFSTALERGYRILAENLIDKFYLIYYPSRREREEANPERSVPEYVLAPITPRAPEMYLDFRSMTGQARHVQGWGGMHFVDVDSLTPPLSWEAFPRPFDMPVGGYTNITYDVRMYASSVLKGFAVEPETLLQEATGLVAPNYSLATPLQPCSRHFWSVRARFTLNGARRVTEWSGAYYTAGGEVAPSQRYFYPFRTPGSGDNAGCWN
jgi:hypothetical protein